MCNLLCGICGICDLCDGSPEEEEKNPILNIEEIVKEYAWKSYLKDRHPIQRWFICRRNYIVDVPMNYFHSEPAGKATVQPRKRQPGLDSGGNPAVDRLNAQTGAPAGVAARGRENGVPAHRMNNTEAAKKYRKDEHTLAVNTNYHNDTAHDQKFQFRMEKTRKSTLTVSLQKGFTIGTKSSVTVQLPALDLGPKVKLGSEITTSLTLTKTDTSVIEETITLATSSDIDVTTGCNCTASAVFTETPILSDFTARSRLTIPQGGFPIKITRKWDNKVVEYKVVKDLSLPFEELLASKEVTMTHEPISIPFVADPPVGLAQTGHERQVLLLETCGIIQGTLLSDHEIKLEESLLAPRKPGSGVKPQPSPKPESDGSNPPASNSVVGPLSQDEAPGFNISEGNSGQVSTSIDTANDSTVTGSGNPTSATTSATETAKGTAASRESGRGSGGSSSHGTTSVAEVYAGDSCKDNVKEGFESGLVEKLQKPTSLLSEPLSSMHPQKVPLMKDTD